MNWSIVVATATVLLGVYYRVRRNLNFFKRRGIPYTTGIPLLGSFWKAVFQRTTFADAVKGIYNLNSEAKYIGGFDFTRPSIIIRDLELIKSITVKNFEHFPDHRGFKASEKNDPLFAKNLFFLRGERWREIRGMLSPAFTSSKMKSMFVLMRECAKEYGDYFASFKEEENTIELKDAFTRYTNDVIATCAFGVNVNSMKVRNNKFYVYGKEATTTFGAKALIKMLFTDKMPWLAKLLGITLITTEITNFFKDVVATTIKTRNENGITRPDMIQLMMETIGKLGPGKELTIDDMTAQAFVFFFGGFESTSMLMCFAAYEVGINESVQTRLQEEIDRVLKDCDGKVTYDIINGMKYLEAIVYEALRMYPAFMVIDRLCQIDFELPPALPGGNPHIVHKGEGVAIPVYGIHYDPQYYPEPEKFKPERFYHDSKRILNSGTFLSFGVGPRMCLGNRFALLETKVLLFYVFAKCDLIPCSKTIIPMKLSKKTLALAPENGFWFNIQPREAR